MGPDDEMLKNFPAQEIAQADAQAIAEKAEADRDFALLHNLTNLEKIITGASDSSGNGPERPTDKTFDGIGIDNFTHLGTIENCDVVQDQKLSLIYPFNVTPPYDTAEIGEGKVQSRFMVASFGRVDGSVENSHQLPHSAYQEERAVPKLIMLGLTNETGEQQVSTKNYRVGVVIADHEKQKPLFFKLTGEGEEMAVEPLDEAGQKGFMAEVDKYRKTI